MRCPRLFMSVMALRLFERQVSSALMHFSISGRLNDSHAPSSGRSAVTCGLSETFMLSSKASVARGSSRLRDVERQCFLGTNGLVVVSGKHHDQRVRPTREAMKAELGCRGCDDRPGVQLVVEVALTFLRLPVRLVWIDELYAANGRLDRGGFRCGLFCRIDERRLEGRAFRCLGDKGPRNQYTQNASNGDGAVSTRSHPVGLSRQHMHSSCWLMPERRIHARTRAGRCSHLAHRCRGHAWLFVQTTRAETNPMHPIPTVTSGVRGALSVFAMAGIVLRYVLGCFLAARAAEAPLCSQLARTCRMIASVYGHLLLPSFRQAIRCVAQQRSFGCRTCTRGGHLP